MARESACGAHSAGKKVTCRPPRTTLLRDTEVIGEFEGAFGEGEMDSDANEFGHGR